MAETFGIVVEGTERARRALDGVRFWDVMERIIPRALTPVAAQARAGAPRGRTGKLTRSPFEIRTRRRFALGTVIEAAVGTRVPYGHLVESGHRNVPRGPTRKGRRISRAERKALRESLRERRVLATGGYTPGRFFATRAMERLQGQVLGLIERLLAAEWLRAV